MNPNRTSSRQVRQREVSFTILEYMEFTNGAEFRKFRAMPPITHGEIATLDWRSLSEALLDSA